MYKRWRAALEIWALDLLLMLKGMGNFDANVG